MYKNILLSLSFLGGAPPYDDDIFVTTVHMVSIPNSLFYTYVGLASLSAILAMSLIIIQIIFRKRRWMFLIIVFSAHLMSSYNKEITFWISKQEINRQVNVS